MRKCPQCRAKQPRMKFFVRHGRDGNNRVIFSRCDKPLPGFTKCQHVFHGVGGWAK